MGDYSLRQIQILLEKIGVRRKRQLAELAIAVRQSQGMDGKAFDAYLESLTGGEEDGV